MHVYLAVNMNMVDYQHTHHFGIKQIRLFSEEGNDNS